MQGRFLIRMGTFTKLSLSLSVFAALSLFVSGCGAGTLAPDCSGFTGQYGAPNSTPEQVANRIVKVYALSNCDSTGQNCRQVLINTTKTGTTGKFTISGLTNGDYLVQTYSVDGTTLLESSTVNLPDVCHATSSPTPTPTPTPTVAAG